MIKLHRTTWPSELDAKVREASAGPGRDGILAALETRDGRWAAGTRAAVYLPEGNGVRRVAWEDVERAEWNADESVLHVWETGPPERRTDLAAEDAGRFGQLLRERISASILVQRHVPLAGTKGVRVVARRSPATTDAAVTWSVVPDKGVDLEQPGVKALAETALTFVREEFDV
ncbi:MAG TPA: hypothetical protein VEK80_03600 [Kribbellaceae bacterium]|nr:hypothetical protein [Kribbellaceae bacterium]